MDERVWHRAVLLRETVRHLEVRQGGVYVDCTVGDAGHALAVLQAALPGGRLLGIDLDPWSLERARVRLSGYEDSHTLAQGSFSQLRDIAFSIGFTPADGILMDLGLSSFQLESEGRGFSFQKDEPLDMRYDQEAELSADQIVNRYPEEELSGIIFRFGEEPRARAIARAITRRRPISSTLQLGDLVAEVAGRTQGPNPPSHAHLPGATHSG